MKTKDFIAEGGMIFHVHEGNRVITIAYEWADDEPNEDEGLYYGATIHQKLKSSDCWLRKDHNQTAVDRCIDHPVAVSPQGRSGAELHAWLRNCLFTYGCRAE